MHHTCHLMPRSSVVFGGSGGGSLIAVFFYIFQVMSRLITYRWLHNGTVIRSAMLGLGHGEKSKIAGELDIGFIRTATMTTAPFALVSVDLHTPSDVAVAR